MNIRIYIDALVYTNQKNLGSRTLEKSVVYAIGIYYPALCDKVKNLWRLLTKREKEIVKKKYVVNVRRNVLKMK